MYTFLIADDHPLFREALSGALSAKFDDLAIIQSDALRSTLAAIKDHPQLDLILLDLQMPGCDHLYGLLQVTNEFPDVPVVVVSATDSPKIVAQTIAMGAKGYVNKAAPSELLIEAIQTVLQGKQWVSPELASMVGSLDKHELALASQLTSLTPKQLEVLNYLRHGLLNKQIAHEMSVTEATVKAHIGAIFKKLGVNTRTQAVLLMEQIQDPV